MPQYTSNANSTCYNNYHRLKIVIDLPRQSISLKPHFQLRFLDLNLIPPRAPALAVPTGTARHTSKSVLQRLLSTRTRRRVLPLARRRVVREAVVVSVVPAATRVRPHQALCLLLVHPSTTIARPAAAPAIVSTIDWPPCISLRSTCCCRRRRLITPATCPAPA